MKPIAPIALLAARLELSWIADFVVALSKRDRFDFVDQLFHSRIEFSQRLKCGDVQRDHQMAAAAALVSLVGSVHIAAEYAPGKNARQNVHHHRNRVALVLLHWQDAPINGLGRIGGRLPGSIDGPTKRYG